MAPIPGGSHGRHRDDVEPARVPPGQYVVNDFPVLSAGPDAAYAAGPVGLRDRRRGRQAPPRGVGGVPRAALRDVHRRHPLRDEVVEAGHATGPACRSTRCSRASRPRPSTTAFATAATRRTSRSPTSPPGGRGSSYGFDGEPLEPEHGGPGAAAGPPPVLLEEREVGARPAADRRGRARLLGGPATTTTAIRGGAAVLGRLSPRTRRWQPRCARAGRGDRPTRKTIVLYRQRLARASRRAARGRPPDRRRRLPGRAQLLDRLGPRGRAAWS